MRFSSLALISARQTITSLEVLTMVSHIICCILLSIISHALSAQLISSYIYVLCQALDLRTLQAEFDNGLRTIVAEEISTHFGSTIAPSSPLHTTLLNCVRDALDASTTMDAIPRMETVAGACTTPLVDFFLSSSSANLTTQVSSIPAFRSALASRSAQLVTCLRTSFLSGERGPAPAAPFLARGSKPVYEFVRIQLGIKMHGLENHECFENEWSGDSVGGDVSRIFEAIQGGKMQGIVVGLFQAVV